METNNIEPTVDDDSYWDHIHEEAHKKHKERVAKLPDRVEFAIKLFKENKIEYSLKSPINGHFHCWRKSDGQLFQFWAGTGKILNSDARGIHSLIAILTTGTHQ